MGSAFIWIFFGCTDWFLVGWTRIANIFILFNNKPIKFLSKIREQTSLKAFLFRFMLFILKGGKSRTWRILGQTRVLKWVILYKNLCKKRWLWKSKSSWGDTTNRKSPIAVYENTIKRIYHYLDKNNQSH